MKSDDIFVIFLFFLLSGLVDDQDAGHVFQIVRFQRIQFAERIFRGKLNIDLAFGEYFIMIGVGKSPPLAVDEFNGPRGDFYKNMFAKCPAGITGTADEVANVAELLMSEKGAFITGSTFLIDGGATSSYYYGPLKPGSF